MNTVFSNIAQAEITARSLNKVWMDLFKSADEVTMATGYVSNDAIKELHKIIEHNPKLRKLDLLVGMLYLEGFTRPQYDSLCELNQFLQEEKRVLFSFRPLLNSTEKCIPLKTENKLTA